MVQIHARHSGRESCHVNLAETEYLMWRQIATQRSQTSPLLLLLFSLTHVGLEPELSWSPLGTVLHLLMLTSIESSWSDSLNMRYCATGDFSFYTFHLGLDLSVFSATEEPVILIGPLSLLKCAPLRGQSESLSKTEDPLLDQTLLSNQLLWPFSCGVEWKSKQ